MKIEIKNLSKIYPRGKKKALNDVNIEIGQGIFGLIGRNGAGKTTLMRIVATIMDATDGEIYFDGKELKANKDEFRSSLGYLPQSTKLMPRMNIVEFLEYVCVMKGMKDKKLRIEDALSATKAAVEEGIVAGGGTSYIDVIGKVEKLLDTTEGDEKTGVQIVLKALEEPVRQIATNTEIN